MMANQKTIVWFRKDLRLHDNTALIQAAKQGSIIPVYILSDEADLSIGSASKWWLHHSLQALKNQLYRYHIPLIIRKGPSDQVLARLIQETNATAIYFNKCCEPRLKQEESTLIRQSQAQQIYIQGFDSALLFSPGSVTNQKGGTYRVFTPFWKQARLHQVPLPDQLPSDLESGIQNDVEIGDITDLNLLPKHVWSEKFHVYWQPGESGAKVRWNDFLETNLIQYDNKRDYPAENGVSKLSPHLAWGEISPREIWHDVQGKRIQLDMNQQEEASGQVESFLRQMVWRDFAYHQLSAFPHVVDEPLKSEFKAFTWRENRGELEQWQRGKTGYPLVDAGMRELWETGWMHNRVRMITASFLVKHLLLHWQEGASWFRQILVDHDTANNIMGWQWVAGSGYDASPYFRIFNPMTQTSKFDEHAQYIRKWLPEIADLPTKYIITPWTAPEKVLKEAGVILGQTYPEPIVDHKASRERALAAYYQMKEEKK